MTWLSGAQMETEAVQQPSANGLGLLLSQHRLALGLTQSQLAERAGLSERAVSDLERGVRRVPYPGTLGRLAKALRLSDAQLASLMDARGRGRMRPWNKPAPPIDEPDLKQGENYKPLTSFIGRERELCEVRALLETVRLLTLTGTGGVGKTRLAIAAAHASRGFEDGLVFLPLAAVRDPSVVLSVIAGSLGLRGAGARSLSEFVLEHLRDKRLLLILDNFEQITEAGPLLPQLLAGAPGLTVLVTSRSILRVTGEHEYPLAPLATPDPRLLAAPDELAQVASVELFVERARAARPQFALTDDNAAAVAELCRYLDGVPLAIELAAARVRVLPPEALLQRLKGDAPETMVQLLTGGTRDVPIHQQTLRGTIDWSYNLLTEPEQAVFRCLGAFIGGCTLEDVDVVRHALPSIGSASKTTVLDHIEGLVTKSLLQTQHAGVLRFSMLETVREYASELLEDHGEDAAVRRAHAVCFMELAERAEDMVTSSHASAWIGRLEMEHGNLRAALQWILDSSEPELALRLTGALWRFWYVRGYLREGGQWLDKALTPWKTVRVRNSSQQNETPALAKALSGAGVLAHYRAEYGLAADLCGEALAVSRRLGHQASIAAALDGLALVARAGGSYPAARAMYQEAADILEAIGDIWGLSFTLRYLAATLWLAADYAAAGPVAQRALAIARELGDQQGITTALTVLSFIMRGRGDLASAEVLARQALDLLEGFGDRRGSSRAHWALGNAIVVDGRDAEARDHYHAALTLGRDISDQWFVPFCLVGLAEIAARGGDSVRAVRLLAARSVLASTDEPCVRLQAEGTIAATRTRLDKSSWKAAWESGRQLLYEEAIDEALAVGARGARLITPTLDQKMSESVLTRREMEVAALVAKGFTNKNIAAELVIAEGTADRHVANILSKLGFASRAQIAAWVVGRGRSG